MPAAPILLRAWSHLIFNDLLYILKQNQTCITNSREILRQYTTESVNHQDKN